MGRQPSSQPTGQPTRQPSSEPTGQPSRLPSSEPTGLPSELPSSHPTMLPSGQPSSQPTGQPSGQPSSEPTGQPSRLPSSQPTGQPSGQPISQPTSTPTSVPTSVPTKVPTTSFPTTRFSTIDWVPCDVDLPYQMRFTAIRLDLEQNTLVIEGAPNSFFYNVRKVVVIASHNGLQPFKSIIKIKPGNSFFPLKLDLYPPYRGYDVTTVQIKAIGHRYEKSEQHKAGGKKAHHPYRLCIKAHYEHRYP